MQGEYRGDFTRDTFDRTKHFSRVLMQQGRVQVDADWNEQASILLHYLRTLATDLVGQHWGPKKIAGEDNRAFVIEKRVKDKKDVINDFSILPGRYYVDGILCENDNPIAYAEQSELPIDDETKLKIGVSLVYLDVWERHVTASDDDLIRETALGGPDTATRAKVVCQVKVVPPGDELNTMWEGVKTENNKENKLRAIEDFLKKHVVLKPQPITTGTLSARARKRDREAEPCSISPESRYRGLENHLYRVEIHKSGRAWDGKTEGGGRPEGNIDIAASFKWSSDNSSVSFPIISLDGGKAMLVTLGRDYSSSLRVNDWVEIVDDDLMFRSFPGPLRQVESIDTLEMSVTLKDPEGLPEYDEESLKHPVLRRWDFRSDEDENRALPLTEATGDEATDWIALEDGIQIQFSASGNQPRSYRSGDYWLIPARTATGDVEWKTTTDTLGRKVPQALPPHGIDHHYAPLAVIETHSSGAVEVEFSCRRLID